MAVSSDIRLIVR